MVPAGDKLYLVMEYAPSGSLLDYVRARKRLSEAESCFFLQQIVAGLQFCHANEVRVGYANSHSLPGRSVLAQFAAVSRGG